MTDAEAAKSIETFATGPFVVVMTAALRDLARALTARFPKVAKFGARYIVPVLPTILGTVYGYFTAAPGQGAEMGGQGAVIGNAVAGLYRQWQVVVKNK